MWKYVIIIIAGGLFLFSSWIVLKPGGRPLGAEKLVRISYRTLKNWSSDQQAPAFSAFKKSCIVLLSSPGDRKMLPLRLGGRVRDWQPSCAAAEKQHMLTDNQARRFFEQYFTVLSYANETTGLFTGYFTPEYSGSDRQTAQYRYPLYALPADLKSLDLGKFDPSLQGKTIIGQIKDDEFIPYPDRKNIDNGSLKHQQLELVWLKDPADVFFMQIQGSGVILYQNGERKIFGYAGRNGRIYQSIGKFLIADGDISRQDMSLQAIRSWLHDNPQTAKKLMWKNPSYIFFRPLSEDGPVGSMNVVLTAGRSLAVDPQYVPLGMPLWLDLKSSSSASPLRRLVIAQDTGGAIKGRMRADVYWGMGQKAAQVAGPMKDRGRFYFLLPKALANQVLAWKGKM